MAASFSTKRKAQEDHRQGNEKKTTIVIYKILPVAPVPQHVGKELTCSICWEVPGEPCITSCTHLFCKSCIAQSLKQKPQCPFCRANISSTASIQNANHPLFRVLKIHLLIIYIFY